MKDNFEKRLKAIDQTMLTPLVRRVLDNESADLTEWRYEPVEGGFGSAYGIYRFQGEAQTEGETLGWSLILKAMGPASGSPEPSAMGYWKREMLVYRSGLLDDLPGDLVAPRCLDIVEYPGQECWLWLEDVVENGDGHWPLDRYGLAARHLGQFNGVYLAGKSIPQVPWLLTDRLRQRLALAEPGVAELPRLIRHPLFTGMVSDDDLARSLRLWANRHRLLAILDRLPRTLCHHDAFRRNLIARTGQDGREQTVAIDWAETGTGVVGEEIVPLFSASLRFVVVDADQIAPLDNLIFAGYVDGLCDAGWYGDSRLARFGFAATAALRSVADRGIKWPNIARRIAALPPGQEPPRLLDAGGPAQHMARRRHLLDLGDEAQALLDDLD